MTTALTYPQRIERIRLLLATLTRHDGLEGEHAAGWTPWTGAALSDLGGGRLPFVMRWLEATARVCSRRIIHEEREVTPFSSVRAARLLLYADASDWTTAAEAREHRGDHRSAELLLTGVEGLLATHHEHLFPRVQLLTWEAAARRAGTLTHLVRSAFSAFRLPSVEPEQIVALDEPWRERTEGGFLYEADATERTGGWQDARQMPRAAVRLYGRVARTWGTSLAKLDEEVERGMGLPETPDAWAEFFGPLPYSRDLRRRVATVWDGCHGAAGRVASSDPPVVVIALHPPARGT